MNVHVTTQYYLQQNDGRNKVTEKQTQPNIIKKCQFRNIYPLDFCCSNTRHMWGKFLPLQVLKVERHLIVKQRLKRRNIFRCKVGNNQQSYQLTDQNNILPTDYIETQRDVTIQFTNNNPLTGTLKNSISCILLIGTFRKSTYSMSNPYII